MEKLFNNIDIFEKICDNLSTYKLFKMREVCKVFKNIIMNMGRFINFNSIVKFSKAIGDDEMGKVIYYYVNYRYGRYDWAEYLFKDYPGLDGDGKGPKAYYVLYFSLIELMFDDHRIDAIDKAKLFSKRKDIFDDHVKLDLKMSPIDFYSQFTQQELAAVGV